MLSATAPRSSRDDEDSLRKKVLELSQENIELRFELEQAKVDLPRLKERVEDLQKYNDALKADLEKAKKKLKNSSSQGSSKVSLGLISILKVESENARDCGCHGTNKSQCMVLFQSSAPSSSLVARHVVTKNVRKTIL